MSTRVGLGFDLHRLEEGRPCVLGGVSFDWPAGPAGHSDGDAVLHALIDALTGAAGLDDVGTLFPDDDPRWEGADSADLVRQVRERVVEAGWEVGNVDVVVVTEGPRIAPRRAEMRARLAELLDVEIEAVNVKGKSCEGMGALAAGAGVAAQAVCLLRERGLGRG